MDISAPLRPEIIPVQKLTAIIAGLFAVPEGSRVESRALQALRLELEGVVGDRHFGFARKSTSREPWYARGTVISNTRQLSILSVEELAEVAQRMNLPAIEPEWVGATMLVSGVPNFSFLPLGTRLIVPDGPALIVTEQNGPCRIAGKAIAAHFPDREDVELGFPETCPAHTRPDGFDRAAGDAKVGDRLEVRVPEQWSYRA